MSKSLKRRKQEKAEEMYNLLNEFIREYKSTMTWDEVEKVAKKANALVRQIDNEFN